MEAHGGKSTAIEQFAPVTDHSKDSPSSTSSPVHAAPEAIGFNDGENTEVGPVAPIEKSEVGWFAYLKTRNFYLVLLLGYLHSKCPEPVLAADSRIQAGPGTLHNCDKHFHCAARRAIILDTCVSDPMELYTSRSSLWLLHHLQIWLQGMGQAHSSRRLEVHLSCLSRRCGQLLFRPCLPIHVSPYVLGPFRELFLKRKY